ncbi:hypothetical protein [Mesorhizobium sp.]|uniref:hypothetical protein n=1 Tax=Mesorhizobium sp. TaxID=1871066 RepID=UPI00257EFB1B|nr:hypothetical protein [Mesorhizobium sp.]
MATRALPQIVGSIIILIAFCGGLRTAKGLFMIVISRPRHCETNRLRKSDMRSEGYE